MKVLTEAETAALVDDELAFEAARQAFRLAATALTFPVVVGRGQAEGTRFTLKSGAADDLVGVKIGSYWKHNAARGLPNHGSSIVLLDPATGRLAAVVEAGGANAYRTAAADALAVQALARPDAQVLVLFGTGNQIFHEARAIARVRSLKRVLVVGRRPAAAAALAGRIAAQLGLATEAASAQAALAVADVVVSATTAVEPLFDAAWVRPGTHISAMGADSKGKHELPTGLYGPARLFCDLVEQSRIIGEFQHAPRDSALTPLGAVLAGDALGRTAADDITIFDSSGFALQDLTLAHALLRRHEERSDARQQLT